MSVANGATTMAPLSGAIGEIAPNGAKTFLSLAPSEEMGHNGATLSGAIGAIGEIDPRWLQYLFVIVPIGAIGGAPLCLISSDPFTHLLSGDRLESVFISHITSGTWGGFIDSSY